MSMIFRTKQDQSRQRQVIGIHNFLYRITNISYPVLERIMEITEDAGLSIQLLSEYINEHTYRPLEVDLVALTYQYILEQCYQEVKAKTGFNIFTLKPKNQIHRSTFATEYNFKGYTRIKMQFILNSVPNPSKTLLWFQAEVQR